MYNTYMNETLTKIVVHVNTAVSNTWHVALTTCRKVTPFCLMILEKSATVITYTNRLTFFVTATHYKQTTLYQELE